MSQLGVYLDTLIRSVPNKPTARDLDWSRQTCVLYLIKVTADVYFTGSDDLG